MHRRLQKHVFVLIWQLAVTYWRMFSIEKKNPHSLLQCVFTDTLIQSLYARDIAISDTYIKMFLFIQNQV